MKSATLEKINSVKSGEIREKSAASAREFSDQLNKLAVLVVQDADKIIRAALLNLFRAIVYASPVDTGQYQANQCIAAESDVMESPKIGVTDINEVLNQISNFNWHLGDGDVWIYNNLPYAEILETGWSQQAPSGVYTVKLNEFTRMLSEEFKK